MGQLLCYQRCYSAFPHTSLAGHDKNFVLDFPQSLDYSILLLNLLLRDLLILARLANLLIGTPLTGIRSAGHLIIGPGAGLRNLILLHL